MNLIIIINAGGSLPAALLTIRRKGVITPIIKMNEYKVLILFGESAVGKDTCLKEIIKTDDKNIFNKMVRCTTRPPREGEIDGKDYFFLTPADFAQQVLNGQMLNATCFNGWHYGTPIYTLEKDKINIGEDNIFGIQCLLEDPHIDLKTLRIKASDKTRLLRSLNREQNPDCIEVCRRFLADKKDFLDAADYANFVYSTEDKKISLATIIQNIQKSWQDNE